MAEERGISTMFSRADETKACPIGAEGACCKVCFMGPCRFMGKDKEEKRGVCGATLATVAARNYIRSCAGGASAHADHGRGIAYTLLAVARGEVADYQIKDPIKLRRVAKAPGDRHRRARTTTAGPGSGTGRPLRVGTPGRRARR